MRAYYKVVNNGYVTGCGTNGSDDTTPITEAEYDEVMAVIRAKPADTETIGYRLKTDLTWEEYPIDPPDPDEDIEDAELLDILMGVNA